MIKVYQIIFICHIGLLVSILIDFGEANDVTYSRPKRFLSFQNISHMFLRLNFKENVVPWTQIIAQAIGFRLNWDEPPDSFHPYHHIMRRSFYDKLEILMDKNGLSGFQCIRRAICEMRDFQRPTQIYHKILKMVFSQRSSATDKWHNVTEEECHRSYGVCPLSVLDISLFTDL